MHKKHHKYIVLDWTQLNNLKETILFTDLITMSNFTCHMFDVKYKYKYDKWHESDVQLKFDYLL